MQTEQRRGRLEHNVNIEATTAGLSCVVVMT